MRNEKKSAGHLRRKDIEPMLLDLFSQNPHETFNVKDIFRIMRLPTHPMRMQVLDALSGLVLDDYLSTDGKGNYRYAPRQQVFEGIFRRKGTGRNSVEPADGGKSILVTEAHSLHALDGDRVRATLLARRRDHTREAEVTEILERAKDTFVGKLQIEPNFGFLITNDRQLASDIFIPKKYLKGGKTGDKAVVKITEWQQGAKCPMGRVVDILGHTGENNAEMHAILAEYNLPYTYPERVEAAAHDIKDGVTQQEIDRREDFREVTTFTIDPRDAKDFDDALSIRKISDETAKNAPIFEVGVHIADVSFYVREGDIIDREAEHRATSVYLVDRTIPMLPERLCNELCSLRQDEDKLAYSVVFRMTENGDILGWHIAHTVIRSNRRFTYEQVQYLLEQRGEASEADMLHPAPEPDADGKAAGERFAEELIVLNRIAKQLRAKRFRSGAIGFDRAEVRFEIDEKGHPISTYVKTAKDANKLVEEFMLLANRSVAEAVARNVLEQHLASGAKAHKSAPSRGKKSKTLPYRIHDVPDPEKLEKLRGFIAKFGYKIRTEGSKKEVSRSLNHLLQDVKGKAEENVVEMVALRAMQKARYSVHNIGHYGLMFDYYTHFTSPIRRYPDLMVHRLLTRYAEGGRSASADKYEELCEHSSAMEQLAETAERASIKYKQVEFMADRLGQDFEGVINGVTEFGFYVELDDNHCEGLVPLRCLEGDYYELDEKNYCLIGRRYHHRYALGDRVKVRVLQANLEKRQLDFTLADQPAMAPQPRAQEFMSRWGGAKGKKKRGRR